MIFRAVFPWYMLGISLLAAVLTVYDKIAAKRRPRRRIPEKTLMLVALLGGAAAMYLVMQTIRHKTLHKKFMVGLPVMLVPQAVLALFLYYSL